MKDFECCICGKKVKAQWGNNPDPVKVGGKCCDECNINIVIPARVEKMKGEKDK